MLWKPETTSSSIVTLLSFAGDICATIGLLLLQTFRNSLVLSKTLYNCHVSLISLSLTPGPFGQLGMTWSSEGLLQIYTSTGGNSNRKCNGLSTGPRRNHMPRFLNGSSPSDNSDWLLPPFLNICLSMGFNKWLHTEQNEWTYTLKYVYIHPYVLVHLKFLKRLIFRNEGSKM